MNSDTLLQLLIRADVDSLRKLSSYPEMWEQIRPLLSSSRFWYLRVQHLVGDRELVFREGDWKTTYFELEKYIGGPRVLKSAIEGDSTVFSIEILLELGFDPMENGGAAIVTAMLKGRAVTLRRLLSQQGVDPSKIVPSLVTYMHKSMPLNTIEVLLNNTRFISTLNQRQRQMLDSLLESNLGSRFSILEDGARYGYIAIVRTLIDLKKLDEIEDSLRIAARAGQVEVLRLLLEQRVVDIPDSTVNTAALEAVTVFLVNLDIIKLLLPRSDPNMMISEIGRPSITTNQQEVLKLLLSDSRVDVDHIQFSESLIATLEPLISSRLLGAYSERERVIHARSMQVMKFLRTMILRSLTPSASIDWLIEQTYENASYAARSVVRSEIVQGESREAFRGYFLCILHHLDRDETLEMMEEEGCSEGGIRLAYRLIGAQLGTERQVTRGEYRDAFRNIFSV